MSLGLFHCEKKHCSKDYLDSRMERPDTTGVTWNLTPLVQTWTYLTLNSGNSLISEI